MTHKLKLALIALIALLLGIVGIALVITWSSWQVALGVFLVMYSDNISKLSARLR